MAPNEDRNPRPSRVIVTDEAFDELLDRAQSIADGESDDEEEEARRRQFVIAVDRAVKKVVTRRDRRLWYTQTLKRYGCRLHFVRAAERIHLIACVPLRDGEEDY
jgi:hypothetical protein